MKNSDYKNLIDNTIIRTLLEDLTEKSGPFYIQNTANLQKKEHLENEIKWLKDMENEKNWDVKQKILTLASEILALKDELADTQLILNQDHLTDDDLLLELVLANMRNDTKFFYLRLQRGKKEKKTATNEKIE